MAQVTNITVTQSRTTKNVYRVKNCFEKSEDDEILTCILCSTTSKRVSEKSPVAKNTESTNRKLKPANLAKKAAGKEGR